MMRWADVEAAALDLPGAERGSTYGQLAVKVRGKVFTCCGKQDDHFLVLLSIDEKRALLENHSGMCFETAHYAKSGALQIHYDAADPELVELLLQRAWRRRASKAQQAELEAR